MCKRILGCLMIGMCIICSCVGSVSVFAEEAPKDTNAEMDRLTLIKEAYWKMEKFYFKEISKRDVGNLFYRCQIMMMNLLRSADDDYMTNLDNLTYSTINMIVRALKDPTDKYSKFIHKDYLTRTIREKLKSSFSGIGIEVEKKDTLYFIGTVYKDSSAFEEGVLKNDQLLEINGESVDGWSLADIEKKCSIPNGESIRLTLLHPEAKKPYKVKLTCRIIVVPSVTTKFYDENNVGYIKIAGFRSETADEFLRHLVVMEESHSMNGLVIDLRGNSGGDETQSVALCSLFLEKDTLVTYFLKRDVGRKEERTNGTMHEFKYPVVLLVDGGTASSAEILTGALKHYGAVFVVGKKTQGLGSLKNTLGLKDGSALFLITSRTYLPDDTTFDETGIAPQFEIDGKNAQLGKAFDIIEGRITLQS